MKFFIKYSLIIAISIICTNCGARHWVAPQMEGHVVDLITRQGIDNVAIYRDIKGNRIFIGNTEIGGYFIIKAGKQCNFSFPIGDPLHTGQYIFIKSGYKEIIYKYSLFAHRAVMQDTPTEDISTIELQKE